MTADVESLTNSYGLIFADLILFPFVVGYYSWDAYTRAGWVSDANAVIEAKTTTAAKAAEAPPTTTIAVETAAAATTPSTRPACNSSSSNNNKNNNSSNSNSSLSNKDLSKT